MEIKVLIAATLFGVIAGLYHLPDLRAVFLRQTSTPDA